MKIVINKCFGGFGLSILALKELVKRGAKGLEVTKTLKYFDSKQEADKDLSKDVGDGYRTTCMEFLLEKDGKVYTWPRENRTDPVLLSVVKKLGSEANGNYAELEIVKIPDGVDYTIEDYDGVEHIAEVHRTWG